MNKYLKPLAVISLFVSSVASAGIITGGDLLDQSGASFLEAQLGLGDLDFLNVSDLTTGGTATQWHADVNGLTDVISIYDITYNGQSYLLGGYSAIGHDGNGYTHNYGTDNVNFIFNLTTNVSRDSNGLYDSYDQWDRSDYFATFGGGHDLFGGRIVVGGFQGYTNNWYGDGYSYTGGQLLLGPLTASPGGHQGSAYFIVNGLESYTFQAASAVPEPSILALMGLGIFGLGLSRRKMKK